MSRYDGMKVGFGAAPEHSSDGQATNGHTSKGVEVAWTPGEREGSMNLELKTPEELLKIQQDVAARRKAQNAPKV